MIAKGFAIAVSLCFNTVASAQNGQVTEINLPNSTSYQHKLKLSDIAEDVEYIPLETTDRSLIGNNVGRCIPTKDYIFVQQSGTLLQFSRDGKFIRQVNKVGQGPGECFARCMAFDEKNQIIYMYNNFTNNIMAYGFDGKFKHRFKDPLIDTENSHTSNMDCDSIGNILLSFDNSYGNMTCKYAVIDPSGKILHKEPNYDLVKLNEKVRDAEIPNSPFYSYQNTLFYRFPYNDTIYRINQNKCFASYVINTPNKLTLEQVMKAGANVTNYSNLSNKNHIYNVKENDKYLFIRHVINRFSPDYKAFLSLYDKQKQELRGNIDPNIVNDIDGGLNVFEGQQNDIYMYSLLWPFKMKEKLTSAHFAKSKALYPEKQKVLKTLVEKLLEDDNPVIMLVKLK
jgi:hypothetical protein